MTTPFIEIKNVSKCFDDQTILNKINLIINNGEFLTLLGPSGCGKTTLLRILSGFENPDHGTLLLNGKDITEAAPEDRHFNMVFQNYALFPHMSVFKNVAFGLECEKVPKKEIHEAVTAMLEKVQMLKYKDRKPSELSGGQQQRVAIARAAVKKPLILLLDEPFSALDYKLRCQMRIELKALQRQLGITFVFVTHDQEEALSMSDRIVVLNHGNIDQVGSPRDIYEEPATLHVAQFIGLANIFPTEILRVLDGKIELNLAGFLFTLKYTQPAAVGQRVNVIIRPEDLDVWHLNKIEDVGSFLRGKITDVTYKGSTVDLKITLDGSLQEISASEFFNEDDDNDAYKVADPVLVRLKEGWEVILPDEN